MEKLSVEGARVSDYLLIGKAVVVLWGRELFKIEGSLQYDGERKLNVAYGGSLLW